LPLLDKSNLDEAFILDPSDTWNQFVFMNGAGQRVRSQLDAVDWNGDGDTQDSTLVVNVDTTDPDAALEGCDG
jgi:hypothetical protein